jgi:hypothetical protein
MGTFMFYELLVAYDAYCLGIMDYLIRIHVAVPLAKAKFTKCNFAGHTPAC